MFEVWLSKKTGVPLTVGSDLLTHQIDQERSGNKRASVKLFGIFTEAKSPDNSLKQWVEAQKNLGDYINDRGYSCSKPGVRRIPRPMIESLIKYVENEILHINLYRDIFLSDIYAMKQQIKDAYRGQDCFSEVEDILDKWEPSPNQMSPVFGVEDLCADTGLVTSETVKEAILKSQLETKRSLVEVMEQEVLKVLNRCTKVERIRGQLKDTEALIEKLAPLITEFSSDTTLTAELAKGLKILKSIPLNPDAIKEEGTQDMIKQGLAELTSSQAPSEPILHPEPENPLPFPEVEPEIYDGAGGYKHNADEPEQPEQDDIDTNNEPEPELEW